MKVNKKYLLLILVTLFSFSIINTNAEDLSNYAINPSDDTISIDMNQVPNEENNVIDNDIDNIDTNDYKYLNEETNYSAFIDDNANLLSQDERTKLFEEIKPLTKYGHVAFVSTASNTSSVSYFADSYYHSHFGTESGTIFIIDMSNREIYIFSDGANYKTVTKSKAYSITDNTYRYATNKDYYGCASLTFKQIYTILDDGKIAEPMRYTSNIFIAITLAFFFSFLYILGKSRMVKAKDSDIANNCDIDFKIGETSAIKTGQHSVYSPVSSSSGGGSSGGGGGGGGGGGSFGSHGF